MQLRRRTGVGVLVAVVLLVAGCDGPAPSPAPSVPTAAQSSGAAPVLPASSLSTSVPAAPLPTKSSPETTANSASPGTTHTTANSVTRSPVPAPTKVATPGISVTATVITGPGGTEVFVPVTLAGRHFAFLVDSGAQLTVLDTRVATSLELPAAGPSLQGTSIGCRTTAQPRTVAVWSVAGHALPAATVVTTTVGYGHRKVGGLPVAGLLGADVFDHFHALTVDFAGRKIVLGGPVGRARTSVPIQVGHTFSGGVSVVLTASLHGHSAPLAVDTGASVSEVNTPLADLAELTVTGAEHHIGAVGCTTAARPVIIDQLTAGVVTFPRISGISSDNQVSRATAGAIQGLLGADILRTYGTITLDLAGQRLLLGRA